jgi:hypothetical protein
MKKIVIFAAITALLYSCKSVQYVPVETAKTEYRDKIVKDSVFRYDSVFVKQTADTVFFERYKYLFKDKTIRDSVFSNDTIRVPYLVEVIKQVKAALSKWQNFQVYCGRIGLALLLLIGVYFVLRLKKILL